LQSCAPADASHAVALQAEAIEDDPKVRQQNAAPPSSPGQSELDEQPQVKALPRPASIAHKPASGGASV
jgi:hypothetical protein